MKILPAVLICSLLASIGAGDRPCSAQYGTHVPDPEITISGLVADSHGRPIPGAMVIELGCCAKTDTREDGTFLLRHLRAGGGELKFGHVGYRTRTMAIASLADSDSVYVQLEPVLGAVRDTLAAIRVGRELLRFPFGTARTVSGRKPEMKSTGHLPPGGCWSVDRLNEVRPPQMHWLSRLIRQAAGAACSDTGSGAFDVAYAIRGGTVEGITFFISGDFRTWLCYRDSDYVECGSYRTDCIADSLRMLIASLTPRAGDEK